VLLPQRALLLQLPELLPLPQRASTASSLQPISEKVATIDMMINDTTDQDNNFFILITSPSLAQEQN